MHIIKYYWSIYSLSYICRYLEIITIWYQLFCGLIWESPLTLLYLVSIFYLCLVKNVLKTLISNQEINDSIYTEYILVYIFGGNIYSRQNLQNAGQFAWAQFTKGALQAFNVKSAQSGSLSTHPSLMQSKAQPSNTSQCFVACLYQPLMFFQHVFGLFPSETN